MDLGTHLVGSDRVIPHMGEYRFHGSLFIHPLLQFGTRLASILDFKIYERRPSIIYLFIYFGWIWAETSYSRARDGPRRIGDRSQLCWAGLLAYIADDLLRLGWMVGLLAYSML